MDKSELILKEIRDLKNFVCDKFEQIDKRFEQIDKRFEQIDKKFEQIEKRFESIETKITIMDTKNIEEHAKLFNMMNTINETFIKFEYDVNNKVSILFDAYKDWSNHKSIYSNEFNNLMDIVSNHSYRISNLEKMVN
ncbi:MAG: hypothetical protein HFJ55_07905 [Clostridia bacterium]|nr:hypothetical protein [Clostridia bacterium]